MIAGNCYGTDMAIEQRNLINNFTPEHGKLERQKNIYNHLYLPNVNQHTNWH